MKVGWRLQNTARGLNVGSTNVKMKSEIITNGATSGEKLLVKNYGDSLGLQQQSYKLHNNQLITISERDG